MGDARWRRPELRPAAAGRPATRHRAPHGGDGDHRDHRRGGVVAGRGGPAPARRAGGAVGSDRASAGGLVDRRVRPRLRVRCAAPPPRAHPPRAGPERPHARERLAAPRGPPHAAHRRGGRATAPAGCGRSDGPRASTPLCNRSSVTEARPGDRARLARRAPARSPARRGSRWPPATSTPPTGSIVDDDRDRDLVRKAGAARRAPRTRCSPPSTRRPWRRRPSRCSSSCSSATGHRRRSARPAPARRRRAARAGGPLPHGAARRCAAPRRRVAVLPVVLAPGRQARPPDGRRARPGRALRRRAGRQGRHVPAAAAPRAPGVAPQLEHPRRPHLLPPRSHARPRRRRRPRASGCAASARRCAGSPPPTSCCSRSAPSRCRSRCSPSAPTSPTGWPTPSRHWSPDLAAYKGDHGALAAEPWLRSR